MPAGGLALSSALDHLHKNGLIHRDLKPSNVLFVNGVPKLADIGLVTDIGEARSYVGTEGFIPPEGPTSPQADLYGLGKVLDEASTGRDRLEFPHLPADFTERSDAAVWFELNEVIVKACQDEPAQRYRTAREMHADLTVLEHGESVHRLRVLERRLAKIKRASSIAAAILVLAFVGYYPVCERQKGLTELRRRQVGAPVAYGADRLR